MENTIIIKIFLLLLFLSLGTTINAKAQSASNIMIAPHTLELNVRKGEEIKSRIKILNKGFQEMPFKVKIIDFTAEDESGKMIFENSESVSPAKWIEVKDVNFILSSEETKVVNFTIKIPEDIEAGGYYATIIFEPQLPSIYFEKEKPRAIPEIGALILFAVDMEGWTRDQNLSIIAEFSIPEKYHLKKVEDVIVKIMGLPKEAMAFGTTNLSVVESDNLSFNVKIKNEDLFHNRYFGKLEITSASGMKVLGSAEVPRITILPGKSRIFPVQFVPDEKSGYFIGKYKARLTLTQENPIAFSGNASNVIEQTIEFWIFPWKYMLIYLVVIVVVYLSRKRIKAALKVLIKEKAKV